MPEVNKCPKCERQISPDADECSMCHYRLTVPEMKTEFVEAFLSLMLHKLGGFQTIPMKNLERFPKGQGPKIYWNQDLQALTLVNHGVKKPLHSNILHNSQIITPN